jgi:LmbE family N-acetylglucosaminyl deacetylase
MTAIVLSPHLDDAVLSCWHLLARPTETTVVNVFAGIPEPDPGEHWWDALTGAADSAERMRARREEDRAALETTETRAVNLELLDVQYRRNGRASGLVDELMARVPEGMPVYAPAALGGHVDHRLVRDAGLRLRAARRPVGFYADLPHAVAYGWPSWVTGGEREPFLDAEAEWRRQLAGSGLELGPGGADVRALGLRQWPAKLDAVRRYRTQLRALEHVAPLECLRHEVVWGP